MKLLFDQNLSPRLRRRLADLYPGSDHVFELGEEILCQEYESVKDLGRNPDKGILELF